AVPRDLNGVLGVLERQRFRTAPSPRRRRAVEYRILRTSTQASEDGHRIPAVCSAKSLEIDLRNFVLFPTDQPGGHALTVLLEPRSKLGLHRFPYFGPLLEPGTPYPIVRV